MQKRIEELKPGERFTKHGINYTYIRPEYDNPARHFVESEKGTTHTVYFDHVVEVNHED